MFLKQHKRLFAKGLITLTALYLLYLLIAALAIPSLLRGFMEKKAGEILQSQVHIGGWSVNPFQLSTTLTDVTVTKPGEKPWISWDTLHVNAQLSSVFTLSIRLDEFRIVNPEVRWDLRHSKNAAADTIDTRALTARFATRNDIPLSIGRFTMRGGAFTLRDLREAQPRKLSLSPISFSLNQFSTRFKLGENNRYSLEFAGPEGGLFRWNGSLQWTPFLSAGTMEIGGLDLLQFSDFYRELLPVRLLSGELAFSTQYRLGEKPAIGLQLSNAHLGLTHLSLTTKDTAARLDLKTLNVDSLQMSTLERTLHLKGVSVDSVSVHYAYRDSTPPLQIFQQLKKFDSLHYRKDAPDSVKADMDPLAVFLARTANLARWQVQVDSVRAQRITMDILDSGIAPGTAHRLDSMTLSVAHLSNTAADSAPFVATGNLNGTGNIQVQGALQLFPPQLKAQAELKNFPLVSLQPYFALKSTGWLRRGSVGASLLLEASPAADSTAEDNLHATGSLSVQNVQMDGPDAARVASLGKMELSGIDASLSGKDIKVAKVSVTSPSITVIRAADESINLQKLLRAAPRKRKQKESPFRVTISQVRIAEASASITDKTLAQPFTLRALHCGGTLSRLSTQGRQNSNFDIKGKLDGYAPFTINGTARLQARHPQADFSLTTQSQELIPFSPYSGKFAGYQISKGQVDADMKYKLNDRQVEGANHIVVRQLTFGDKVESPDAVKLPVRLGVALLSDRDGVMDLDIGIQGNLDDPEFSVGGMIWKVIKNLIGKAAAAPMKTLMALMGSDEDLQSVSFDAGSSSLNADATRELNKLAGALAKRPQLQMEIQGSIDRGTDEPVLQEAQLIRKIAAASRLNPDRISAASIQEKPLRDSLFSYYRKTTQKDWKRWLKATAPVDSLHPAQPPAEAELRDAAQRAWEELRSIQPIPATDLSNLALDRAQSVKTDLMRQDSTLGSRLFVLEGMDSTQTQAAAALKLKTE